MNVCGVFSVLLLSLLGTVVQAQQNDQITLDVGSFLNTGELGVPQIRERSLEMIGDQYERYDFDPEFVVVIPSIDAAGQVAANVYGVDYSTGGFRADTLGFGPELYSVRSDEEWLRILTEGGLAGEIDVNQAQTPIHSANIFIASAGSNGGCDPAHIPIDGRFATGTAQEWGNSVVVANYDWTNGTDPYLGDTGFALDSWSVLPVDNFTLQIQDMLSNPTPSVIGSITDNYANPIYRLGNEDLYAFVEKYPYVDFYADPPLRLEADCQNVRLTSTPDQYFEYGSPTVVGTSVGTAPRTILPSSGQVTGGGGMRVCPGGYYIEDERLVCLVADLVGAITAHEVAEDIEAENLAVVTDISGCSIPQNRIFSLSNVLAQGQSFTATDADDVVRSQGWPQAIFANSVQNLIIRHLSEASSDRECLSKYAIFDPVLNEEEDQLSQSINGTSRVYVDVILPSDGLLYELGSGTRIDGGTRHFIWFRIATEFSSRGFKNSNDSQNVEGQSYWRSTVSFQASTRTNATDILDFWGFVEAQRLTKEHSGYGENDFDLNTRRELSRAMSHIIAGGTISSTDEFVLSFTD